MKTLFKKLSLTLLLVCTALSFTCFAACGSDHVHTYEETISEKYLKNVATCKTKAVYYKSCSCGEASETETFEGALGDHSYENKVCTVCGKKQPSEGLSFELNANKTEYSVASAGTCTDTDLVLPETYNGLPVTSIANYAFKDCNTLTSVTLSDNITNIGYYAFEGCSSLKFNEYDNAYYLESETNNCFWLIKAKSTDIESCSINENCKHIYSFAFENCTSLTSIKFNAAECANLSRVGNNATHEEKNFVFHNVGTSEKGITVTIGKNVKSIPENLFFGVSNIKEVAFEENSVCESIGSYAFNHCVSLATLRLPNSVKHIEYAAFDYCTSLENIYYGGDVNEWAETEGLDNLMCYSKTGKQLYTNETLLTEANITSATKINTGAFNDCASLASVIIGDKVTSIGDNAFKNCDSLNNVTIGKNISNLGSDVFFGCPIETANVPSIAISSVNNSKLTTLSVTSGASIAEGVLSGCTTLKNLTIGDTVTDVGNTALGDCKSLSSIKVEEKNEKYKSIDDNLYSKDGKTLVKYAIGKSAIEFTVDGDVTGIDDYAFYNCTNLTNITIGNGVTSVGDYAFKGCSSLKYNEDDNAYYLGNEENKYLCLIKTKSTEITSYAVNENCKFIYCLAFENCDKLTSVTIGSKVTVIGEAAFNKCGALTDVYYKASESDWANIAVSKDNEKLIGAKIYYYSESEPTDNGNYWHIVDGKPAAWKK